MRSLLLFFTESPVSLSPSFPLMNSSRLDFLRLSLSSPLSNPGVNNGELDDKRHTYAVVINDIDNDGELAGIRAIVDHDNTANLNDTLESRSALQREKPERKKVRRLAPVGLSNNLMGAVKGFLKRKEMLPPR